AVEVARGGGKVWRPTDVAAPSGRTMTLREGLVYSKNSITAQVMQDVGVGRIVALAQAMGVDQSKLDPVPSLALGTSPVTLLEMVSGYATIAQLGEHRKPLFIKRISDRQGTGTQVKTRFGLVADIAGKTGTTQNNTDGWFILMHPSLVAGAWVGFNDSRVTMRSDYWGQGGHNAILVVGDFFRSVLQRRLINVKASFPPSRRPPLPPSPDAEPLPVEPWSRSIETIVRGDPAGLDAL